MIIRMKLLEQTRQLKEEINRLQEIYEKNNPPESFNDKVFFEKMKKETTEIYQFIGKWKKTALSFIAQEGIAMYSHQIKATREVFELLILHSYYIDVTRKRYMELNHSCLYICDQLINVIKCNSLKGGNDNE